MTEQNLEQQRAIYGQPLSERFSAVMSVFGLTQRSLAQVLGLSAPMLSQLSSGQRIKIGNPAVYERLVMLEESVDAADKDLVLERIRTSEPQLTTHTAFSATGLRQPAPAQGGITASGAGESSGGVVLEKLATATQLRAVAQAAITVGAEELGAALTAAAERADS